MLAVIYLALGVYLADLLCRRFYRFVSLAHRWAAAVLVGILLSSWFTYLAALVVAHATKPLLWADVSFFAGAIGAIFWLTNRSRREGRTRPVFIEPRTTGSAKWDWIILATYSVAACWLMFSTLSFKGGDLMVARNAWGDLGPNMALTQSFAVGHNFPTQYPLFAGEPIRYHFLFYFQAGNLEFLGLNPAWSINILSILSLVCMLALVMALGQVLFNSRVIGRVGSALFFFHGSLSFIPFLRSQSSPTGAVRAVINLKSYLSSGYPYLGENWGIWTLNAFTNQRHLAGAIGVFLVVLIFLVDRYRKRQRDGESARRTSVEASVPFAGPNARAQSAKSFGNKVTKTVKTLAISDPSFLFSGVILGALPFWNAPVFVAAFAVLVFLFLLFPYRYSMLGLALAAGTVALPQVLYLRSGSSKTSTYSLFHWGYVVEHPTLIKVLEYLGFTFGLKWPLIILSLIFVLWLQRKFFIAISSLLLLTFFFRFSPQIAANHKFLNVWLIVANLFVAHGLWELWHIKTIAGAITGRVVAIVMTFLIVTAGVIDLFPMHNDYYGAMGYDNDPVLKWVLRETEPNAIFLSERFVIHPILLAGRRIFYGWPGYADSAGYDTATREAIYRDMLENKDPRKVFDLLKTNGIAYVAFDNPLRRGGFIKRPNEQLYAKYFPKVFQDKQNRYDSLTIYKVPETAPAQFKALPKVLASAIPATTMFKGGKGIENGQFDFPRGIAVDPRGNVLVADTVNNRIQKFSSTGVFLGIIAQSGSAQGELKEPSSIAIDQSGHIYVADTGNNRVQKLKPDGSFLAEWKGLEPGFYGPRDVSIGPDNSIYVVDEGNTRIVKLAPDGQVLATWGKKGNGEGEFDDPTSVAVDPISNRVYVADPRNRRIEVFDSNGQFIASWFVDQFRLIQGAWYMQHLAINPKLGRLYATSTQTDEVLVFDLTGKKIASLRPRPPDRLEGASALAIVNRKLYVLCAFSDRVVQIPL